MAVALLAAFFAPLWAVAEQTVSPPTYELQVSFDLARSKLFGKAVLSRIAKQKDRNIIELSPRSFGLWNELPVKAKS